MGIVWGDKEESAMESVELLELMEVGDDIALLLTQAQCRNLGVSLGDALHVTPTSRGFSLHSDRSDTRLFFEKAPDSSNALTGGAN